MVAMDRLKKVNVCYCVVGGGEEISIQKKVIMISFMAKSTGKSSSIVRFGQ